MPFGVKIKFCRNLRNFLFHQDAVNTEGYSVSCNFLRKSEIVWRIVGKKSVFTLNIHKTLPSKNHFGYKNQNKTLFKNQNIKK